MATAQVEQLLSQNRQLALENEELKARLEAKSGSDTEQSLKRRLAKAQEEKAKLVVQLEQEEEFLTNTLQKKLNKLRKDKIDMENQLEQEQEFIVNKLQKRLAEVTLEKSDLEKKLDEDSAQLAERLKENVRRLQQEKAALSSELEVEEEALINKMSRELDALQERETHAKAELEAFKNKYNQLKKDHEKLEGDNFILTQKLKRQMDRLAEVTREKGNIESDLEMDNERLFNARGSMSPLPGAHPVLSPRGSAPASPLLVASRARMKSLGDGGLAEKAFSPPGRLSLNFPGSPSRGACPASPSAIDMPASPHGMKVPPAFNLAASGTLAGTSGDDEGSEGSDA